MKMNRMQVLHMMTAAIGCRVFPAALFAAGFCCLVFAHAQTHAARQIPFFDQTGKNISRAFRAGMYCNTGDTPPVWAGVLPGVQHLVFDARCAAALQSSHVILIPGGEFDAVSELLRYCQDGTLPVELEHFFEKNPTTRRDIERFLQEYVCATPDAVEVFYNTFLGTFREYEALLAAHAIPYTRLDYFAPQGPSRIGDRIGKLDLIADTIDAIESGAGSDNASGSRQYVLIGHSFGGLNICDLLVELAGGHAPGTPEWKFFAETRVRAWPALKKQAVLKKIKAAVFLNSFIQGNHSNERRLENIAAREGLSSADPVGDYLREVLARAGREDISTRDFIADEKTHLVLITARYRTGYYLTDSNNPAGAGIPSVQNAFTLIAGSIPLLSVGCIVPRYAPYLQVGLNLLVYTSRDKWDAEHIPNDGAVNTYGGIFPRPAAEQVILRDMDHGTLVMKPDLRVITTGSSYDQLPFIKTLLAFLKDRLARTAQ
jgi:pimeloyl-ACP methyl ester carboxylesterase